MTGSGCAAFLRGSNVRNFVYISQTKVDLYHGQLPPEALNKRTAKVSIKAGMVTADVGSESVPNSSLAGRALAIADHVVRNGEVGDLTGPKAWIGDVVPLGSIVDGSKIAFGAIVSEGDSSTYLCLTASTKHMIGYEYEKAASDSYVGRSHIGSMRSRVFNMTSNNLGFAGALSSAFRPERAAAEDDFEVDENERSTVERVLVGPHLWRAYKHKPNLNRPLAALERWRSSLGWFSPQHLVVRILRYFVIYPFLRLYLSKQELKDKVEAVSLLCDKPNSWQPSLGARERKLLSDIRGVVSSCSRERGYGSYEFLAVTLLEGEVDGDRVIIASPLYIASV